MKRRKLAQLTQKFSRATEHKLQHELKEPRGFEPGRRPTKETCPNRSKFISALLAKKRAEKLQAQQAARLQEPSA